ncbi:hypothetical protein ACS0TY_028948 [Phlomoides rotata]
MGRPPCCDKANVKRGPWTPEEDAKILAYVASHGIGNWTLVPQKAGLNRCGKSCRLRWTNYLRPDLKHDNFTPEEEECILEMHKTIGSRWSLIARQLPGRTDNDVKNYWNTKLKKKLSKLGIDPITHKPFSQLFSEYGKISGSHISRNRNPFLQNLTGNDQTIRNNVEASRFQITNQENHVVMQPHFLNEPFCFDAFSCSKLVTRFGCGSSASCEPPHEAQMLPSSTDGYVFGHHFSSSNNDDDQLPLHEEAASVVQGNYGDEYEERTGVVSAGILDKYCSKSVAAAAADTFVEDMLAHDSEMRLQFPDIFGENYADCSS